MEVSALVVTWNSAADVRSCLDAALAQRDVDLEVVVVDNASTDGTREVLAEYAGRVTVLLQDANLGYAAGNNAAAEVATGRHLLLLNPDCTMDPDCVRTLVDHVESTPGVGAAAALLRYPDGRPQSFLRRDVTLRSALLTFVETGRRVDLKLLDGRAMKRRICQDVPLDQGPVAVDCPAAACVLVPAVLGRLGGRLLDPDLPLLFNDAELYRRLRLRGYRVELVPAATARHGYGASLETLPDARRRAEAVVGLRRYVSPAWSVPAVAVLTAALVLDAVLCLLRGRTRVTGKGTLGGLGLPGGAVPWLSTVPPWRHRLAGAARRMQGSPWRVAWAARRSWRRQRFGWSARAGAAWSRCDLRLDVARHVELPRRFTVELPRGGHARLVVRDGVRAQDGLVLRLSGDLLLGPLVELRYGALLTVSGSLVLEGRNLVSRGTSVHAAGDMVWEWAAGTAEQVVVVDSEHRVDGSTVHVFDHPVEVRATRLGSGCFLGAGTVVTSGVLVGRGALVGAGSVVTRDVPAGALVAGSPARLVRTLPAAPAPTVRAVRGRTRRRAAGA